MSVFNTVFKAVLCFRFEVSETTVFLTFLYKCLFLRLIIFSINTQWIIILICNAQARVIARCVGQILPHSQMFFSRLNRIMS